jgi:hypothetical protein
LREMANRKLEEPPRFDYFANDEGRWVYQVVLYPEIGHGIFVEETFDAVLYAACKAVLNARQVATTQPPPLEK